MTQLPGPSSPHWLVTVHSCIATNVKRVPDLVTGPDRCAESNLVARGAPPHPPTLSHQDPLIPTHLPSDSRAFHPCSGRTTRSLRFLLAITSWMLASSIIAMALPSPRSLLLGALVALPSLPAMASAWATYTQADMMQAQLALLDGRPPDCPPWYVPRLRARLGAVTNRRPSPMPLPHQC